MSRARTRHTAQADPNSLHMLPPRVTKGRYDFAPVGDLSALFELASKPSPPAGSPRRTWARKELHIDSNTLARCSQTSMQARLESYTGATAAAVEAAVAGVSNAATKKARLGNMLQLCHMAFDTPGVPRFGVSWPGATPAGTSGPDDGAAADPVAAAAPAGDGTPPAPAAAVAVGGATDRAATPTDTSADLAAARALIAELRAQLDRGPTPAPAPTTPPSGRSGAAAPHRDAGPAPAGAAGRRAGPANPGKAPKRSLAELMADIQAALARGDDDGEDVVLTGVRQAPATTAGTAQTMALDRPAGRGAGPATGAPGAKRARTDDIAVGQDTIASGMAALLTQLRAGGPAADPTAARRSDYQRLAREQQARTGTMNLSSGLASVPCCVGVGESSLLPFEWHDKLQRHAAWNIDFGAILAGDSPAKSLKFDGAELNFGKAAKRKVDLDQWATVAEAFGNSLAHLYPAQAPRFRTYAKRVVGHGRRHGHAEAVLYDKLHRNAAVAQGGAAPDWEPCNEFFLQAFTDLPTSRCGMCKGPHFTSDCPERTMCPPATAPPAKATTACKDFNSRAGCRQRNCGWPHICNGGCGAATPRHACTTCGGRR